MYMMMAGLHTVKFPGHSPELCNRKSEYIQVGDIRNDEMDILKFPRIKAVPRSNTVRALLNFIPVVGEIALFLNPPQKMWFLVFIST